MKIIDQQGPMPLATVPQQLESLIRKPAAKHRALISLRMTAYLMLQTILIPAGFIAAIIWSKPFLFQGWQSCLQFWSVQLDLPLQTSSGVISVIGMAWMENDPAQTSPTLHIGVMTFGVTLLIFLITFSMKGKMLPVQVLIRMLCGIQLIAMVYFWLNPDQFPYSFTSHLNDLVSIGYGMLIAIPVMLALGYYPLNFSIWTKLGSTVLILAYFVVMIPHQVILHLLILQHFSSLAMPILYIFFGAIFDVLIFIALYSWAASNIPKQLN